MKVGAENRKELVAAIVLALVAVLLLMRMVFSSSSSAATPTASVSPISPVPQPTDRRTANRTTGRKRVSMKDQRTTPLLNSLDPRLRLGLLKSTEDTIYEGHGRNIFRAQMEEIPKPIDTGHLVKEQTQSLPPQPPPPPPILLKFYGFANKPGEPRRIFLTKGDDVFIAREGEIVDHRYKVVRINLNSVEIEDVLSNNRQSIPLTPG